MKCGWMDVRYRFLSPTSTQYIDYLSVKLTLISESRSTVLRGSPRLTYKCKLYT
jgi:hypothetical protein